MPVVFGRRYVPKPLSIYLSHGYFQKKTLTVTMYSNAKPTRYILSSLPDVRNFSTVRISLPGPPRRDVDLPNQSLFLSEVCQWLSGDLIAQSMSMSVRQRMQDDISRIVIST